MTVTAENIGDARPVYVQLSRAWYGAANLASSSYHDEVNVGFDAPRGGTYGEYGIRWYDEDSASSPVLEVFDDGWSALAYSGPVVGRLAGMVEAGLGPYPTLVCSLLGQLGFHDNTGGGPLPDHGSPDHGADAIAQEPGAEPVELGRSYVRTGRPCREVADQVAVTVDLAGRPEVEQGTFYFRWINLTTEVVPRIEAEGSGLSALAVCPDLTEKLGEIDGTNPLPEEICRLLKTLSFMEER